jgi:GNAT superfamily N-acetyltransferase
MDMKLVELKEYNFLLQKTVDIFNSFAASFPMTPFASSEEWLLAINNDGYRICVCQSNSSVIGAYCTVFDDNKMIIRHLCVKYQYQNRGVGAMLLNKIVHDAHQWSVEAIDTATYAGNWIAAKLLTKNNFVLTRTTSSVNWWRYTL